MVSASRRLKLPSKAARLRSIIVAAAHPEAAEQRGVLEHFPDGAYRRGIVFEGSSSDADDEFDLLRCGSGLPTACATPQARARASAAACGSTRLIARLALRLALRRHEVNRVVRDARRWSVGRGVQSERRPHTHDSTFSRVEPRKTAGRAKSSHALHREIRLVQSLRKSPRARRMLSGAEAVNAKGMVASEAAPNSTPVMVPRTMSGKWATDASVQRSR